MTPDGSVVIAGLGLRLGPAPAEPTSIICTPATNPNEVRVFVTELVQGGAAERSNLLRLNDEILHVDHTPTHGRSVVDVKNAILGTPGTSVRIGIRRNNEQFELSFVRGHTQGAAPPQSSNITPSSTTKGTPTNAHASAQGPSARPTPKALFRSPGGSLGGLHIDAHLPSQVTLQQAARRGDMEQVALLAAELTKLAHSNDAGAVRDMLLNSGEMSISPKTVSVAHTPRGVFSSESPTLLYDGQSPSTQMSIDQENALKLLNMIEPLMDFSSSSLAQPPPPIDKSLLRDLIISVSGAAANIQMSEPRMLDLPAPCYVLGDIHGNLTDLQFFRKTLWPAGLQAQAGDFLLLGDFVDRGLDSVPVVAYIVAQKVLNPHKWWMIRGNHETREVNGNVKTYREGSFLHQCTSIFGEDEGRVIWERANDFFDTLPIAARIDNKIFCVHGGLPRELCLPDADLQTINEVPCPLKAVRRGDMVHAMLWSDPVPPEKEATENALDKHGFGLSSRGCACFGEKALDLFLERHGLAYVFRGHEAQQWGIGLSRSARLCTIFSTSKDHFSADAKTTCGCVLVDHGTIVPIIRGAAPKPAPAPIRPQLEAPAPAPQGHQGQRGPLKQLDSNAQRGAGGRGRKPDDPQQQQHAKDGNLFVC